MVVTKSKNLTSLMQNLIDVIAIFQIFGLANTNEIFNVNSLKIISGDRQ
jgi:hypothetical protein